MIGFKKIFDYFTFTLLGVLALPTSAILITWNTLPGENLYPLKQKLEDVALLLTSVNFGTQADLHAKIVDRRFQETTDLLELSSGIGLPELTTEIDSVKDTIVKKAEKTTKAKDAKVVKDKAEQMITQLKEYDQELEKEKQKLASQPSSGASSSQVIVKEVYQTQKEIQVIVKELEVVKEKVIIVEQAAPQQQSIVSTASPSPSPTPKPSPSPSPTPMPSPSPSPTSEPGDLIPIDAGPGPVLPPTATPTPSPDSSPVVIISSPLPTTTSPSPKAPAASVVVTRVSPSPTSAPAVEGVASEKISLYPLAFEAIICSLIGLLTLVFVKFCVKKC